MSKPKKQARFYLHLCFLFIYFIYMFLTLTGVKVAVKLQTSVTNEAIHFLSSIQDNARTLLVISSLHLPPATLQLCNEI